MSLFNLDIGGFKPFEFIRSGVGGAVRHVAEDIIHVNRIAQSIEDTVDQWQKSSNPAEKAAAVFLDKCWAGVEKACPVLAKVDASTLFSEVVVGLAENVVPLVCDIIDVAIDPNKNSDLTSLSAGIDQVLGKTISNIIDNSPSCKGKLTAQEKNELKNGLYYSIETNLNKIFDTLTVPLINNIGYLCDKYISPDVLDVFYRNNIYPLLSNPLFMISVGVAVIEQDLSKVEALFLEQINKLEDPVLVASLVISALDNAVDAAPSLQWAKDLSDILKEKLPEAKKKADKAFI